MPCHWHQDRLQYGIANSMIGNWLRALRFPIRDLGGAAANHHFASLDIARNTPRTRGNGPRLISDEVGNGLSRPKLFEGL